MKHDFKTLVNRKDKYSRKWDMMYERKENIEKDIPPFSVADHDLKYPKALTEGFKDYVDNMIFGYSMPEEEYYNSFIAWIERRYDFKVKREWILDGNGVVASICNSIKTFSDVGDGVIIMTPVYPPFAKSILNNKRKVIENQLINTDGYYTIDFKALEGQCSIESNKILIMCSPHNPVGRVWSQTELSKVAKICNKHNVLVISDEIHMDVLLDNNKHFVYGKVSEEALNNSIVLTSASKSFNLAGARTSMIIIADENKRQKFDDYIKANCHISLNAFGFKLFEIAYNDCEDWFDEFLKLLSSNNKYMKDYIEESFPKIKVTPMEGTYLLWLDFREYGMSDDDLFDFLVDDCQIFINRGDSYGDSGSGFVRWNIATPKWVLEAALERLRHGLEKLGK